MIERIFSWSHKVYFADTDQAGVVHHSRYLAFFEAGRIEALAELGYPYFEMQKEGFGLAPVKIDISYLSPLRLEDVFEVRSRFLKLKAASVLILQEIFCGERLCSRAEVKLACLDERVYAVRRVPEDLARLISDNG